MHRPQLRISGSRKDSTRPRLPRQRQPLAVDAMVRDLVVIPAWIPVASLVPGCRVGAVYPVLDTRGALVGTLDLAGLAERPELHDRLAGELCTPFEALSVLGPNDRVVPGRLPGVVVDQGRLIGILPSPARVRRAEPSASAISD